MLTNRDIEKLKQVFLTKEEAYGPFAENFLAKAEFNEFKDKYYTGQDLVVKMLGDIKTELSSLYGLYKLHDEKIDKIYSALNLA